MNVGSLFSGIGGLDLGLERAGHRVIWQAETDPYASRVLAKHWPDVPNLGDVKLIDWGLVERPDLLCGGFPCQPVSIPGKRLAQADERWLWPEVVRCVRHLRPAYVLMENVPGLLVRGMGDVLGDLAALGYDAEWDSVPAAAVGAPHLRYRVFVVAYPGGDRLEEQRVRGAANEDGSAVALADSNGAGPQGRVFGGRRAGELLAWSRSRAIADQWGVEPALGRVAHGVPRRVDRLRCLGNAVVPQVGEFIGRRVQQFDGAVEGGANIAQNDGDAHG